MPFFLSVLFSTEARSRGLNRPTTASLWLWTIGDYFWLRLTRLELRANPLDLGGLLSELFGQKLNFFLVLCANQLEIPFQLCDHYPLFPRLSCAL
jgi:hypothetical protein